MSLNEQPLQQKTLLATIDAAWGAQRSAHAPYSGYQVGAALLTGNGQIFSGCNVENRSYGLTICAERAAVCAAMAAGAADFRWLTLVLPGAQPPCGACLQVLSEFCQRLPIALVDVKRMESSDWRRELSDAGPESCRIVQLHELLPLRFELEDRSGREE